MLSVISVPPWFKILPRRHGEHGEKEKSLNFDFCDAGDKHEN